MEKHFAKTTAFKICPLILLLILSYLVYAQCPAVNQHQDYSELMALYNATDGPNWIINSGWINGANGTSCDPCADNWYGLVCVNNRVVKIHMDNNQLTGSLPVEIGDIDFLGFLSLNFNALSGAIPAEIGYLSSLAFLSLSLNDITGNIPIEIANLSNLSYLILGGNQLSGTLPTALGNVTNLVILNLAGNQLSGNIPIEIGNLTNLSSFNLTNNQISGSIPTELGNLINLEELYLGSNQLTGSIPIEIENLNLLEHLNLNNNALTGNIPSEIGNLTNLISLNFTINQLDGSIPVEIGNLLQLENLQLGENNLTGNIPNEIQFLTNLNVLKLNQNHLMGNIPLALGNLTELTELWLHTNQLSSSIPVQLTNLSNLDEFYLHNNQLSGCLEDTLVNFICTINNKLISNNSALPYTGNLTQICNDSLYSSQNFIGAPCNDNDPTTFNDEILADCTCGTFVPCSAFTFDCKDDTLALGQNSNTTINPIAFLNYSNFACISEINAFPSSLNCGNIGQNSVVISVLDSAGNIQSCQSSITLIDAAAPICSVQDITVNLNQFGAASILPEDINLNSTDNCSLYLDSVSPCRFRCNDVGSLTVTLVTTDFFGNMATCEANVTVQDPFGGCNGSLCCDGLQNADEFGVDCGGNFCPPCGE